MTPKKISRKSIKEDKFVATILKIAKLLKVYWKLVVIAVIGLLIIVGAFLGYGRYRENMEQKALLPLSEAFGYFYQEISSAEANTSTTPEGKLSPQELEKYQKALNAFSKVVHDFPRTRSGQLALLYQAQCYYQLSNFSEAIKSYESFVKKYKNDFLTPFAWQGLGYCYEIQGNYKQAINTFLDGIKKFPKDFLTSQLYIDLGRNYEMVGEYEQAKEAYNSLLERFPNSVWIEEARYRISWINAHR
jgi:tetratricopeptide (TPR) repeat protein